MSKINFETHVEVFRLWLLGLTLEVISEQVKVSLGSVRNFVKEFQDGKYPEFAGFQAYLEGMRYLAKQMASNNLSLPQVVTGLAVFNALVQLGLDPGKLLELFRLLQRIVPHDFPQKNFVQAALRIAALEESTGLSYEQLETRASTLKVAVPELEASKKTLTDAIGSLKASKTEEQKNLDKTLEAKNVTLRMLETYERDVAMLTSAGFKIEDVRRLADFLMKAVDEGYAAVALELSQQEKQTGKNYNELLAEYKRVVSDVEATKQELSKSRSELNTLNDRITKLKQEMEKELESNKTTRDQLKRHINTLRQLVAIGVDFEQLDALQQLLSNIGQLGWKAQSVVTFLKSIVDLDEAKKTRENELANINGTIAEAKKNLESLSNQTTAGKTELANLISELTKHKNSIAQLTQLEIENSSQIELVNNLMQLMRDPSKLSIEHVSALMMELQIILGNIMRPESYMYPPDFAPIRKKTRELFETLFEKEYVPKEEADAERKRLGDQNADLMMDKLGKMEQQRRNTEEERIEVQKENDEATKLTHNAIMMTQETALKLAANLEAEGTAKSYICILCNSTFTICLGPTGCNEPKTCPSCSAPLIQRVQRFR